jgi:hypothetical protein
VRKGGGLGNFIWLDSQDMAGVDKMVLRACTVWLIGVQREANEIKRNLSNIPAGVKRPKPEQIASLDRCQFYACFEKVTAEVYVQPAWMTDQGAIAIATGERSIDEALPPAAAKSRKPQEAKVKPEEAQRLRDQNRDLTNKVAELEGTINELRGSIDRRDAGGQSPILREVMPERSPPGAVAGAGFSLDEIWAEVKRRAVADPSVLKILTSKPEIEVLVERKTIQIDGSSLKGRVARLIAQGFMREGVTHGATRTELKRTGPDVNSGNLSTVFKDFVRDGFLTLEGDRYKAAPGMKVTTKDLRS